MWRYPTPFASTFLRASRAGDAALDLGGVALRAESDRGFCIDERHTVPGRFRASSLPTRSRVGPGGIA
jgi:hypothetical protein